MLNLWKTKSSPDVGSAVRQIRIDKGMTIEALSRITKIRIEELNNLEQGGNCPVPDYFMILTALGYDWDQIVDFLAARPDPADIKSQPRMSFIPLSVSKRK